jgi:hypothetical protein
VEVVVQAPPEHVRPALQIVPTQQGWPMAPHAADEEHAPAMQLRPVLHTEPTQQG